MTFKKVCSKLRSDYRRDAESSLKGGQADRMTDVSSGARLFFLQDRFGVDRNLDPVADDDATPV
jgi:hypothetical protein